MGAELTAYASFFRGAEAELDVPAVRTVAARAWPLSFTTSTVTWHARVSISVLRANGALFGG